MQKNNSKTVLTIVVGLIVFYFIFKSIYLLYGALAIGILSVFSSFVEEKISLFWLKLAEWLGFINSKVILTVVFFFILFPIAMLSRLLRGNKTLGLKKQQEGKSYYKERNHTYQAKDLENSW